MDLLQPQERRASVVMVVKAGCAPRAHQSSGSEHPDAKATVSELFGILDNPDMVVTHIDLESRPAACFAVRRRVMRVVNVPFERAVERPAELPGFDILSARYWRSAQCAGLAAKPQRLARLHTALLFVTRLCRRVRRSHGRQ